MFKENQSRNCTNCPFKAKAFKYLLKDEIELINNSRHEVNYKPGETIFKQGSACTHVVSINSGMAKIYLEGYNRKQLIIRLVKPNEFIASPGLNTNNGHYYSISAIEHTTVCFLDVNVIRTIFKQNHVFSEMLMRDIHSHYSKTLQKLINLNQKHRLGRISEALLYLSEEIYESDIFDLTISKKELSDMAGMSTESSFRILKELNDEGYIKIEKKRKEIKNKTYLRQVSEKG